MFLFKNKYIKKYYVLIILDLYCNPKEKIVFTGAIQKKKIYIYIYKFTEKILCRNTVFINFLFIK